MEQESALRNQLSSPSLYEERMLLLQQMVDDAEEITALIDHADCRAQLDQLLRSIKTTLTTLLPYTQNSRNQSLPSALATKWEESEKRFNEQQHVLLQLAKQEASASDQAIIHDQLKEIAKCYSSLEPSLRQAKLALLNQLFPVFLSQITRLIKQVDAEKAHAKEDPLNTRCFLCYAPHYLPQRISRLRKDLQQAGMTVYDLWQANDAGILNYIEHVHANKSNYVLVIGTPALKQAWDKKEGSLYHLLDQLGTRKLAGNQGIIKILYAGQEEISFPAFLNVQTSWDFHHSGSYCSNFLTLLEQRLLQHLPQESLATLIAIKTKFSELETDILQANALAKLKELEISWQADQCLLARGPQKTNEAPTQNKKIGKQEEGQAASLIYSDKHAFTLFKPIAQPSSFADLSSPPKEAPNSQLLGVEHRLKQRLVTYYEEQAQIEYLFYDLPAIPISQAPRLALVKELEQKDKELTQEETSVRDERLVSFEKVYGTETPIALDELFTRPDTVSSPLTDNNAHPLTHLLILGRAGIGKTTLCQYLAYQWANNKDATWIQQYDWVWWIPLRNLATSFYTRQTHPISLAEVIHRECFNEEETVSVAQIDALLNEPARFLLVLDGYDELAPLLEEGSLLQRFLEKKLFRYPNVIVTTRPYAIADNLRHYQRLENIGFLNRDIEDYVTKFFTVLKKPNYADSFLSFLKKNPSLWGIAHIPINLELMCSLWEEKQTEQQSLASPLTVTELYTELVAKLSKRYLLKRSHHPITKTDLEKHWTAKRVQEACQSVTDFLSELAYESFTASRQLLIDKQLIQMLRDKYEQAHPRLFKDILEAGLLKNIGKQLSLADQGAYFLHLTFQEYFVACYIVSLLRSQEKTQQEKLKKCLQAYAKEPRYEMVWGFVAGLVRHELNILQRFFDELLAQTPPQHPLKSWSWPFVFIDFSHLQENKHFNWLMVMLRCLEECQVAAIKQRSHLLTIYRECALHLLLRQESLQSVPDPSGAEHYNIPINPLSFFSSWTLAIRKLITTYSRGYFSLMPNLSSVKHYNTLLTYLRVSPQVLATSQLMAALKKAQIKQPEAQLAVVLLERNQAALKCLIQILADPHAAISLRKAALVKVPYLIAKDSVSPLITQVVGLLQVPALKDTAFTVIKQLFQGLEEIIANALAESPPPNDIKQAMAERFYQMALKAENNTQKLLYYNWAGQLGSSQAWFEKGTVLYGQEQYDQALTCYNQVVELNPKHVAAWYNKGLVLSNQRQYEQALACFGKILNELDSKDVDAWYSKGLVLSNQRQYEQALACFGKVIELAPTDTRTWYAKAWLLGKQERYQEALVCYDKLFELDPTDKMAWYGKAELMKSQKQYDQALVCYDKLLELNPTDEETWYGKGDVLVNQGQHGTALVCFDRILNELNPTHVKAWYSKGLVLSSQSQHEQALVCYEKAIKLDSRNANDWDGKGALLYHRGWYEQALRYYEKALMRTPNSADAWLNTGKVLNKQGQYAQAIGWYNRALALDRKSVAAWYNKGYTLYCQGKQERALHCYNQALSFNPNDEYVLASKGILLLLHASHWAEAKTLFEAALQQDPGFPFALQGLGLLAYLQHQQDQAQYCFSQVKHYHEGRGKVNITAQLELYHEKIITLVHFGLLEEAKATFKEANLIKSDYFPLRHFEALLTKGEEVNINKADDEETYYTPLNSSSFSRP